MPTEMYTYVKPPEDVHPAIIVELAHCDLIERQLGQLQVVVLADQIREEPALDLARIPLGLEKPAASGTARPVDLVLDDLRGRLKHSFGGWTPAMEADNGVQGIIGFPQTKPMYGADLCLPTDNDSLDWPLPGKDDGDGVRIGVLDTGLFPHERFRDRVMANPTDLYTPPPPGTAVRPGQGHATFCAGIIARLAPAATIIPRRVLGEEGTATVWDTARGLVSLLADEVDIINVALGYHTADGSTSMALQRAVDLVSHDSLVVAAAGNQGVPMSEQVTARNEPTSDEIAAAKHPTWPAAHHGVIAVGAAVPTTLPPTGDVELAEFTPKLPWVTCIAPGYRLLSTYLHADIMDLSKNPGPAVPFEELAVWSGTSFACCTAVGAIAARTKPGRVSPREALRQLLEEGGPLVRRYTHPA